MRYVVCGMQVKGACWCSHSQIVSCIPYLRASIVYYLSCSPNLISDICHNPRDAEVWRSEAAIPGETAFDWLIDWLIDLV